MLIDAYRLNNTEPVIRIPKADVLDVSSELILVLDVPGVEGSGIDLTVEKQLLTVRAIPDSIHRVSDDSRKALVLEKCAAIDERTFMLQDEIDVGAITASLANGLLTVRLPKNTETGQRRILVDHIL